MFTSYYIFQHKSCVDCVLYSDKYCPLVVDSGFLSGGKQEYFHHNAFLLATRGLSFHIGPNRTTTFSFTVSLLTVFYTCQTCAGGIRFTL